MTWRLSPVAAIRLECWLVGWLVGWSATVAYGQQRPDQLFPQRGSPASGLIQSFTPTEVIINVRGTDQKFSVLDVKRITYGDEPRELTSARDNILNGQLENGLDQLKRIDATAISRSEVKQDLEFYLASTQAKIALTGGGDKVAASQALMAFARSAPKSYHFTESAELLGNLAVAQEKYEDAARFYAYLTKTAKEAAWSEYELRVGVLEGRVAEAEGKYPEAIARFDSIIAASIDTAEANRHKSLAQVGKTVALAETGQAAEALKLLQDIIQKNDPQDTELFGRAYNAQGRCYSKTNQPKEALLAYLHVDTLYFQHADVHAEALYNLSKLWTTVNKSDRAVAARQLLNERYAGSVWAKKN